MRIFREQVGAYFGVSVGDGGEDDGTGPVCIPGKTNWAGLFGVAAVIGAAGFALGVSMASAAAAGGGAGGGGGGGESKR